MMHDDPLYPHWLKVRETLQNTRDIATHGSPTDTAGDIATAIVEALRPQLTNDTTEMTRLLHVGAMAAGWFDTLRAFARMARDLGFPIELKKLDTPQTRDGWCLTWALLIELPVAGPTQTFELRRKGGARMATPGEVHAVVALSDADADLGAKHWWLNSNGYARGGAEERYLHRVVAERMFGPRNTWPVRFEVDHIDRDKLNCARHNLRLASPRAQKLNLARAGTSVRQHRTSGRWMSLFGTPQRCLGTFDTKADALQRSREELVALRREATARGEYVNSPENFSQVSWRLTTEQAGELNAIVPFTNVPATWDGHSREQKYERLRAYAATSRRKDQS